MGMDKDLASAIVSTRCDCYDSALESAKKVMGKDLPPDQIQATRNVIRTLGAWYFRQQCMDKIMECYNLLQRLPEVEEGEDQKTIDEKTEAKEQPSQEVCTTLTPDVYEIFSTLTQVPENENKDEAELLREAITLLILKHSLDENIREKVLSKAEKLFSSQTG